MNIEDLKYIIENRKKLEKIDSEILIKDNSSMLKSLFLIFGGLFEIFGLFITIAFLFTNEHSVLISSLLFNILLGCFIVYINSQPLLVSFFEKLQKRKILNLNIKKDTEIFNLLVAHEYSNSQIKKILKYYNSLNKYEKDYFDKETNIENYLFIKVLKYIENNDIQYIQDNQEELTELVFDNFNEGDINEILVILKNKINKNKNQKRDFINILNKNNKQIIKEI